MAPINDYRAVVYSEKNGGDKIYDNVVPTEFDAKMEIASVKDINKAKYPNAVGSIQNRKTGKWVYWQNL